MAHKDTTCRIRLDRGIAYAQLGAGVLTPKGLLETGEDAAAQLAGRRPAVFIADFRRLIIALKTLDLDALFDAADPALCAPAALVVQESYLRIFKAHAWNVAQAGILRRAFTDYAEAERWAQMRLLIHRKARTAP